MALSKRDYEVYKSGIDKLVYKYLSRDRTAAASLITTAVDSGADKRKLAEKLTGYADKGLAHKLADKSFQLLEELGVRLKSSSRKRSHKEEPDGGKDGHDKETKKPRTEVQQRVSSPPPVAPLLSSPVSVSLQQKQIQDIMAKAQAAIEERKRALSKLQPQDAASVTAARIVPATNGAALMSPTVVTPAPSAVNSRIAELQARIRSQIGAVSGLPAAAPVPVAGGLVTPLLSVVAGHQALLKPSGERPPPIILDSEGRTLDLTGKEVHITSRAPTLKANIRAKKREEFKQQLAEKPSFDEAPDTEFYDPRVPIRPSHRHNKMSFKFHEQGKFIQLAQRERAKSRLEKLQSEILTAARRTGISSAARLAQMQGEGSGDSSVASITPAIEWWDAIILEADSYPAEGEEVKAKADYITNLVEHPLEIRCPSDLNKAVALQVFLTAKERKKLRRMNRREAWKEKQDKIRLGLEPPPEPKVRMANLMRVLGTEAVLDPTKMERHVRDQMAKRLRAHEQANAARKLTPQQRKEKRLGKLKEDISTGVHVSVYRVTNLSNGSHKFKVETNAKQLFMTGTVVLFQDVNVVVVEGGPKQQKKYRQLMMHRIKWVEEARATTNNIEPKCQLVWEGAVLDRNFGEIQFKSCPSESFARDHFKRHNVEHYWDMAYGKKMAEEAELSSPL